MIGRIDWRRALTALLCCAASLSVTAAEWLEVDYGEIVDRRQLSHSGESVDLLLGKLGGRPADGATPTDRQSHNLLDPLVEPYAFVLPDAVDSLFPVEGLPMIEVAPLWHSGEAQPAWVELLRSRRFVVESDGAGQMRLFLPWQGGSSALPESKAAAGEAWSSAWPVLRHLFRAEGRRLQQAAGGEAPPPIAVTAYPYLHHPERSIFLLGDTPHRTSVEETAPDGLSPPVDLRSLREFLSAGLRLEGARLDEDGSIRLLGSKVARPPAILGGPLTLADLAVAYRAVFHGGRTEPYMSLDRGFSPQMSVVNYGGRLRDTGLGWVSLLCDIRFKTFSLGLDIALGKDLRPELVAGLPSFRTHLERLAANPESKGVSGQQTRLWFYPDNVDLTISAEGDVLVLRKVRMSAASQRVEEGTSADSAGEDPPWTRATIDAINNDYDRLSGFFPELADLDQVVRLLSLFTWMKQADAEGRPLPELDALLAVELPQLWTPRLFPQLLAFNALPEAGSNAAVDTFDRVALGDALEALNANEGSSLPAVRRYRRAVAALNPRDPQDAALLEELRGFDPTTAPVSNVDRMSTRAERLRMHKLVLATLPRERRARLQARVTAGETLRPFSLGIGGLDLGMSDAVARARGTSLTLAGLGGEAATRQSGSAAAAPPAPRPTTATEAWRVDPAGLQPIALPDHGLGLEGDKPRSERSFGNHRIETGATNRSGSRQPWIWTVLGADSIEVVSRKLYLDDSGKANLLERVDRGRRMRYRIERNGTSLDLRPVDPPVQTVADDRGSVVIDGTRLPDGLAVLGIGGATPASETTEQPQITLRMDSRQAGAGTLQADVPRWVLQRLVLGPAADLMAGRPLPGFSPLPPALGAVATMMVRLNPEQYSAPWSEQSGPTAGEEDPAKVARALNVWWQTESRPTIAVVGTDPRRSPGRWNDAPRTGSGALLWLPEDGFDGPSGRLVPELRSSWTAGQPVRRLPPEPKAGLIVLVTAEPPGKLAARLRALASEPALYGKLLAVWPLAGPLRADLPAALLDEGVLAGVGLASSSVVGQRDAGGALAAMGGALGEGVRVETLPGPFLWYF